MGNSEVKRLEETSREIKRMIERKKTRPWFFHSALFVMQFEYASNGGNNKLKEIIRKFTAT